MDFVIVRYVLIFLTYFGHNLDTRLRPLYTLGRFQSARRERIGAARERKPAALLGLAPIRYRMRRHLTSH
jgi:hypothetical protein